MKFTPTIRAAGLKLTFFAIGLAPIFAISQERAFSQEQGAGVDHAAVLAPFLKDDTTAVAYVDLSTIDPAALVAKYAPALNLPPAVSQKAALSAALAKAAVDSVRQAGVDRVYAVVGMGDVQTFSGPLVVAPLRDVKSFDALRTLLQGFQIIGRPASSPDAEMQLERHASGFAMFGSKATLVRYAALAPQPRADLLDPLGRATAGGAAMAAVVSPDANSRRVIRELWPSLSAPFDKLSGSLIADRLKHVALAVRLQQEPLFRLTLETTDADAAAEYQRMYGEVRQMVAKIPDAVAAQLAGSLAESLDVTVEGPRMAITLPLDKGLGNLGSAVLKALDAAGESARRAQRMNNFKQLLLGLATYASVQPSLLPAAICDADGKPLLSWRVAVLPYIDQKPLYEQFHLNEPWDSPHNRELIKRMPTLFADPDAQLAEANRAGKTVYQVPLGADTIFFKKEGTKFSEIADGTNWTIMLVEVLPERAVEWTKPADWEVNMQKPLDGVQRSDRDGFAVGFADAHVEYVKNNVAADKFRALLTRAGKEEIKP